MPYNGEHNTALEGAPCTPALVQGMRLQQRVRATGRPAADGTVAVTIGTPGQFYIEVNNQMDARLPQAHVIDPTPVHSFHVFVDPDFGDEPGPLSPSPGRVRVWTRPA